MAICASKEHTPSSDRVSSWTRNLIPNVEAAFNFTHLLWHLSAGSGLHFGEVRLPSKQSSFNPGIHTLLSEWTGEGNGGGRIRSRELAFIYKRNKPHFQTGEDVRAAPTLIHTHKTVVSYGRERIAHLLRLLTDSTTATGMVPTPGALTIEAYSFTMADLCRVVSSLCACRTNAPWRLFARGVQIVFKRNYPTMPSAATCPLLALAEPPTAQREEYISGRIGRLVFHNAPLGLRFVASVEKCPSCDSNGPIVVVVRVQLMFE